MCVCVVSLPALIACEHGMQAALMYCKMLRENSSLGFPGVLSLHSRNTSEADRLGVIMESLRQMFDRKLGDICRPSQWPEFDKRFNIALKKWSESDSHLFYDVRVAGRASHDEGPPSCELERCMRVRVCLSSGASKAVVSNTCSTS